MPSRLYTDSATGRLAGDISDTDTTIILEPGQGTNFPLPAAGDWAILTLEAVNGDKERVRQTARSGDQLTVERGAEGTTALPFVAGSRCELRLTSSAFSDLAQVQGDESITGQWEFTLTPGGIGMDAFPRRAVDEEITGEWDFQGPVTFATATFSGPSTFTQPATFQSTVNLNNVVNVNGSLGGPGMDGVFAQNAADETITGTWTFTQEPTFPAVGGGLIPPGAIIPFAGTAPPTGWLACNGQAVSRTTYAALFAAIGTVWGTGDGSTTFNLPNLTNEFIRGSGGVGVGGAEAAQMPAHRHTVANRPGGNVGWSPLNCQGPWGNSPDTAPITWGGGGGANFQSVTPLNSGPVNTETGENRPQNKRVLFIIKA